MKNVVRFKSTAMIIALISAFSFTACKSDEPSGPNDPSANTEKKTLTAQFEAEVSDAVFNSYDLVVNIWTDQKELVKDDVPETAKFLYNIGQDVTDASYITCQVIATAKKELPEYDEETLYKIMYKSLAALSVTQNGKTTSLLPETNAIFKNSTMSLKGSQISEYVAKHPNTSVIDVTYKF